MFDFWLIDMYSSLMNLLINKSMMMIRVIVEGLLFVHIFIGCHY